MTQKSDREWLYVPMHIEITEAQSVSVGASGAAEGVRSAAETDTDTRKYHVLAKGFSKNRSADAEI